ncbi:MAG: hypothetical protein RMJ39_10420 [Deltaproteobacteria bacterium]|nr:hypothetical protein [Deltaproteobacteria bacterium]
MKRYEIFGKTFIQKPLVLRQTKQLVELFSDTNLSKLFESDIENLIKIFAKKGAKFLAIVLIPEGVEIKDKDMAYLEELFEDCDLDTFTEVVKDFFLFNNLLSLIQKVVSPLTEKTEDTEKVAIG